MTINQQQSNFTRRLSDIHLPAAYSLEIVNEMLRRLVEVYNPIKVCLIGSIARGDFNTDLDLDFVIIVPDDVPAERRSEHLAVEALWPLGKAADVVVMRAISIDALK